MRQSENPSGGYGELTLYFWRDQPLLGALADPGGEVGRRLARLLAFLRGHAMDTHLILTNLPESADRARGVIDLTPDDVPRYLPELLQQDADVLVAVSLPEVAATSIRKSGPN